MKAVSVIVVRNTDIEYLIILSKPAGNITDREFIRSEKEMLTDVGFQIPRANVPPHHLRNCAVCLNIRDRAEQCLPPASCHLDKTSFCHIGNIVIERQAHKLFFLLGTKAEPSRLLLPRRKIDLLDHD